MRVKVLCLAESLANNSAEGQERTNNRALRVAGKRFKIWKLGKEIERRIKKNLD
jgi:hypothetical protein